MGKYKDMIEAYKAGGLSNEKRMWESVLLVDVLLDEVLKTDSEQYYDFLREQHEIFCGPHFNEEFAKWQVSQMHHTGADGKKYSGEHWSIEDAHEVAAKYKTSIPSSYNICDVYVGLNASYHDMCKLYKSWFPDNYEERIIETAITFWFKDEDYGEGKVWEYFD